MLEHYARLKGEDGNYKFYRAAGVAFPLLMLAWALLTALFRLR
jgi:hypothetical protein